MPYYPNQPFDDVRVNKRGTEIPGTAAASTIYGGLLLIPSTGTYGNGFVVATAAYSSSQIAGGKIYQCQIVGRMYGSTTPWDTATAHTTGKPIVVVVHEQGYEYWLKGSSLTVSEGDILVVAGSGLVEKQQAHIATFKIHHYWVASAAFSSATWVRGVYRGLLNMYTTS